MLKLQSPDSKCHEVAIFNLHIFTRLWNMKGKDVKIM